VGKVERWIDELGYNEVPGALLSSADRVPTDHPFATEVEAMFNAAGDVGASAVLCIDRVPTVCLVDEARLSGTKQAQTNQIRRLCERLWNQNLARIVLVAGEHSLEAWSIDDPKAARETILASGRDLLSDFSFQGLLSGEVLKNRANWFDPHKRVDKVLLDNVGVLVKKLTGPVAASAAREITASVIFVAYLEDRGIITEAYRTSRRVSALIDLLEKADAVGIERLFGQLQKDFNGDFLAPDTQKDGMWRHLPASSFSDLHQFLRRTVLRSGQEDFWRYNFAQIPIELIAGIYETFLGQNAQAESVAENSVTAKRKQGAYYT
jgi:hypothetical protein